jgi:bifunctional non-homologous end joining protein LigD
MSMDRAAQVPSALPDPIRLQIVTSTKQPPAGDGWLHEIKYDGHRLIAMVLGRGQLKLISRNGFDRTPLFRGPFRKLAASGRPSCSTARSRFLTSGALRISIG